MNCVQRLLASTVAGSVVWLAGAEAARADLILVFANPVARPGAVIEAVTADPTGRPEAIPALRGIRVYLVPMTAARSPRHQRPSGLPHDPRWIPLGPLNHRRFGVVRFRFTVPDIRPGDYTLGFWCRRCAPPRGATFTDAYPGTEWTDTPYSKVIRVRSRPAHRRRSPVAMELLFFVPGVIGGVVAPLLFVRAFGHGRWHAVGESILTAVVVAVLALMVGPGNSYVEGSANRGELLLILAVLLNGGCWLVASLLTAACLGLPPSASEPPAGSDSP